MVYHHGTISEPVATQQISPLFLSDTNVLTVFHGSKKKVCHINTFQKKDELSTRCIRTLRLASKETKTDRECLKYN